MQGMGGSGGKGMAGGGGASAGPISPNHKIPLRRYYEVTEELRCIPVALVLIVDAHRMNDVLAAFADSRIRFRTVMSPWCACPPALPDFLRPHAAGAGAARPGGAFGPPSSPKGPGDAGGATGTGAGAGPGVGLPGGGGKGPGRGLAWRWRRWRRCWRSLALSAHGPLPGDEEVPQVEIQIFGLVTLYESPDAVKRIEEERKNAPPTPTPSPTP